MPISHEYIKLANQEILKKYAQEVMEKANELEQQDRIRATVLVLRTILPNKPVNQVQILRAAFNLPLREAKNLVDAGYPPTTFTFEQPLDRREDVYDEDDDLPF